MGVGLLGNDERLFTGVGVQSVDRVVRVVGQGAAVPHRGLSYIQDLVAHRLLEAAAASGEKGRGGTERGRGRSRAGRRGVKEGKDGRRGQEGSPVSSKTGGEVIR